jgi:translation initiation factor 3 subunit I
MKTYVADTPLNSASITPKKDFVILGGGQDAMGVTQTDGKCITLVSPGVFYFSK